MSNCLYYSVGRAPNDPGTQTIRNGLYAQSPFSPAGEIDMAATAFGLAALPATVAYGLLSTNEANDIAVEASRQLTNMIAKAAAATNTLEQGRYGYGGVPYHYSTWTNANGGEFWGNPGTEASSIDLSWTLGGLLVCGNFFGGESLSNYHTARDTVDWAAWLDLTPPHSNQFRMSWSVGGGFSGHWDYRTDETAWISIFGAAADTNLDARALWNAWTRETVAYTSPPPDSLTFECCPSYFGDPFCDFYGLLFLDTGRFPPDVNGVDWFQNNATSYKGHVEFWRKERGFTNSMSYTFFFDGADDAMAEPKGAAGSPVLRTDCPIHVLAGGLPFYGDDPESNELAQTLALLAAEPANLYDWHGWPVATVLATNASHPAQSNAIVGQNICQMALSIDNYLTHRIQDIALQDEPLRNVLNQIFPPLADCTERAATNLVTEWQAVPFSSLQVESSTNLAVAEDWFPAGSVPVDASGRTSTTNAVAREFEFFRLSGP
ncbi:MAG: hypothetical protein JXR37_33065 [Kiritimatiellae bacterium]|nr:hypothetical protein [Kiritimatiellia bacterium]